MSKIKLLNSLGICEISASDVLLFQQGMESMDEAEPVSANSDGVANTGIPGNYNYFIFDERIYL